MSRGGSSRRFQAVGLSVKTWMAVAPTAFARSAALRRPVRVSQMGPDAPAAQGSQPALRRGRAHAARSGGFGEQYFDSHQITGYSRPMDHDLLDALKALSDASRLRIVGLLAGGRRMAVEELAAALDLTPGTVVHHLKRLSRRRPRVGPSAAAVRRVPS